VFRGDDGALWARDLSGLLRRRWPLSHGNGGLGVWAQRGSVSGLRARPVVRFQPVRTAGLWWGLERGLSDGRRRLLRWFSGRFLGWRSGRVHGWWLDGWRSGRVDR
jgi:hypothetical protein